ncbi:CRISPR-associated endonuclease Cas1 [Rhizobium deserti]|uniref:CRISPR-associated endonuclease Cas1 n=1 Tax=Rhizobium deserti TaxID=2547961 RepID=A0A4R5U6I3_9HYPH|nr:CRISPR-associated endonuclease Cas1 [Rhizobium deserti]TDK29831.1 CRISPR-associated endonuclease Cas1 [Rhizobium deserti]
MTVQEPQDLWQRVTSLEALQAAWHRVADNDGSAGGDGISIRDFGEHLFANLTELRVELLSGSYRSGAFRKVSVPKKKQGYRILTIPSVRDRIVHTSITNALTPLFEPLFEDGSFAYRPNRGVVHAVQRIETWRKRGFDIVIEADIVSYFDNIDQSILKEKVTSILSTMPGSAALLELLSRLLKEQGKVLGTPGQGIVQGSPLSPLLANLYLDALDEEIEAQGVKIVRFADDFVILCRSEKKAEKVLAHAVTILGQHNLRLHEDGTRIVSFDRGFDFIGYLFLRTLALKENAGPVAPAARPVKSEVTDEGIITLDSTGSRFDPGKRVLYVLDARHMLGVRNRSFSVRRDDGSELISIPHQRVGRIEIGPFPDFSRKALDLALEHGIEFSMLDGFGQTRGSASTSEGRRASLQLAQAKAILTDEMRLAFGRALVASRIRNQRTQLMRLNRTRQLDRAEAALEVMFRSLRKIDQQQSIEALRGIEGSASAAYWPAIGCMLSNQPVREFRRQRPAEDPLNAAINYLTAILERDTRAAIQSVGLHPGFGFLHASKDRHDGLIYDMMEPFRAALTEGIAIYLFNAHRLRPEMFLKGEQRPIEMNDDARRAIVGGYEAAVAKRINPSDGGAKLTWRAMILHQARGLANAVRQEDHTLFRPYIMEA